MAAVMEERPVALFGSAGQAVHIAFAIMAHDAPDGSPFRQALMRVMESIQLKSDEQRAWLDQLRGSGGVANFSGLTSNEIRAQCALITQAVRTKLPKPESAVLLARNSPDIERKVDGSTRFLFSVERVEGIQVLSTWLAPSYPRIKVMALDCILARLFKNHAKIDITSRDLADNFGGCHTTYLRASRKIKAQLSELENIALARLDPYFRDQGVID